MHLDYAIYELLKNAMRAVVEYHWSASSLPAVNVHIAGSPEQITLRFSDQVSIAPLVLRYVHYAQDDASTCTGLTGRRNPSTPARPGVAIWFHHHGS